MRAFRAVLWLVVGSSGLWALLALALFPGWSVAGRGTATLGFLGIAGLIVWRLSWPWRPLALAAVIGGVGLLFNTRQPARDRDWSPDVAHQATASFAGDRVSIQNVRHATYRSPTEYTVAWEQRHYDLRQLRTVDFLVEPFSEWRALAHTLVSFGFADGEHVAISVETRKQRGQHYSPLLGLFRHYELVYVVGDERDLIGLRANIRRDRVHLYPIRTSPAQARAMFVSMLQRANQLAQHPEFYHSLFSTCTSNIRRHAAALRADGLAPDWRTVFPGYADQLAWDLGLIDFDGSLEQARQHFLINPRSGFGTADGKTWSAQIRAHTTP